MVFGSRGCTDDLKATWTDGRKTFSLLSLLEQRHVHDYLIPSCHFNDEDILRLPLQDGRQRSVVKAVKRLMPNEDSLSRALLRVMEDLEDQDSDKLAS